MVVIIRIFVCVLLIILGVIIVFPVPEPICIVCGGAISMFDYVLGGLAIVAGLAGLGVQFNTRAVG
jgi:hypothetical protein